MMMNKSKIISAAMAAALALSLAACGNVSDGDTDVTDAKSASKHNDDTNTETESEANADDKPIIEKIVDLIPEIGEGVVKTYYLEDEEMIAKLKDNSKGVNTMTDAMIKAAVSDTADNKSSMISGFSAYSCISSAANYAEGATKEQIETALGVMTPDALQYFKDNMPIETGTMFLIDDAAKLNAKTTKDFVFDDLQSDGIVDLVNSYVSDKTHKLIPTLITQPFGEDTRAVILDTLYFKGAWEHKFDKNATDKQVFHGTNGDVETDFMHTSYDDYGVNVDDKIIELAYENSNLVMDICYDIGDKTLDTAFSDYVSKSNDLQLVYSYDVNLSMPKFETESFVNLTDTCKSLGMTNMFDPACCGDFKSLADDVYVSDIVQKTKIIVDEEGTEAAAVTMMTMDAACAAPEEPQILDIIIDKPFVYAIRDTETNIILFAGYVNGF